MGIEYNIDTFWNELTKVSSFKTTTEAKDHVNAITKRFHFAVRIVDSGKTRPLTLVCTRSGKIKPAVDEPNVSAHVAHDEREDNDEKQCIKNQKKETRTKKAGCTFKLKLPCVRRFPSGYVYEWGKKDQCILSHDTHDLNVEALSGLPELRRPDKATMDFIAQRIEFDMKPKEIIRELPQTYITPKDISSMKHQKRKATLLGSTDTQVFLSSMRNSKWYYDYEVDPSKHLLCGFMMDPRSVKMLQLYSSVVTLDCTYKTNKYSMPFLDIVGTCSTWQTFPIAIAFLKQEREIDYIWALQRLKKVMLDNDVPEFKVAVTDKEQALLNALEDVFPNSKRVLCRWHVLKNIELNVKPKNPRTVDPEVLETVDTFINHWKTVQSSQTWQLYNEALQAFQAFAVSHAMADRFEYVYNEYLLKDKEKIVDAGFNDVLHLGHTETSRVESFHNNYKKEFSVSTKDLNTLFRNIQKVHDYVFDRIRDTMATAFIKTPTLVSRNPILRQLNFRISFDALKRIGDQLEKVNQRKTAGADDVQPCTAVFKTTFGLPCSHDLEDCLDAGREVELQSIHPQWHIVPTKTFLEPGIVGDKFHIIEIVQNQIAPEERLDYGLESPENQKVQLLVDAIKENRGRADIYERLISGVTELATNGTVHVLAPHMAITRGRRPNQKKGVISSSNRRERSAFELAFGKQRVCSICHAAGHNKRRCPQNGQEYDEDDVAVMQEEVDTDDDELDMHMGKLCITV
jgi:hypothetical protein